MDFRAQGPRRAETGVVVESLGKDGWCGPEHRQQNRLSFLWHGRAGERLTELRDSGTIPQFEAWTNRIFGPQADLSPAVHSFSVRTPAAISDEELGRLISIFQQPAGLVRRTA